MIAGDRIMGQYGAPCSHPMAHVPTSELCVYWVCIPGATSPDLLPPAPSCPPDPPDPPELLPDNCLSQSRPQPLEISPGTEQGPLHWLHISGGYNLRSHVAEIVEIFSCIPHQIFTLQVQCTHCQFEQVMDMDTLHNTYKSSLSASPIAHC